MPNTPNPIDEAIAHLGAALIVANETDEQIIVQHIRDAHALLSPLHSAYRPSVSTDIRMIGIDKCCEFHSAETCHAGIGERFVFSEEGLREFADAIMANARVQS